MKIRKLDDPLQEVTLPNYTDLGINHHSPTQCAMPDGPYVFRYLCCNQETRRLFEGNANMAAGIAVNDALQWHYSDTIWKHNPNTKKLQPQDNEKLTKDVSIQKALAKFEEYNPVNDKDRDKFEHYKETIPQTIRQGFLACESLGVDKGKEVTAEDSINNINKRLQLPIVGRSDLHFKDFNDVEQSTSASASKAAPFLSVLEFKTVWQKPMKVKKDGTRSFSHAKLPSTPSLNHLQQLSFYAVSLVPCFPHLIYLSADGFQIFNSKNCADLEIQNVKNYYDQLVKICIRRERMLQRHSNLNDAEEIIKEIISDTDPQFDHNFYWNIGHQFVQQAKELWRSYE